jgi:hypothetical protein
MSTSKVNYRALEQKAYEKRTMVVEAIATDSISLEHFVPERILPFLHEVNSFISIKDSEVEEASSAYENLAELLVKNLNWPRENIKIHPQGSAISRTLIRSPYSNDRFDIDAICEIDHPDAYKDGAIKFFTDIGQSLEDEDFDIDKKKRCWRVLWRGKSYYIDLTPAVKSNLISIDASNVKYFPQSSQYSEDAVWVVNEPTGEWYSSNPRGFSKWVLDRNIDSSHLVYQMAFESLDEVTRASAEPVPEQDIGMDENLLLAIRLFKRHRDMQVYNNKVSNEFKPISVIIVTLLGQCVNAMRANGRHFSSIVELLEVLAATIPELVDYHDGQPVVPNPTAPDENFADRWLEDSKKRMLSFYSWVASLQADLRRLSVANDDDSRQTVIKEIFGCSGMTSSPSPGNGGNPLASGVPGTPSRAVPDRGLA